jgi:hypothetical protein
MKLTADAATAGLGSLLLAAAGLLRLATRLALAGLPGLAGLLGLSLPCMLGLAHVLLRIPVKLLLALRSTKCVLGSVIVAYRQVLVFVNLRTAHWVSGHRDYLSGRLTLPPNQ